MSVPQTSRFTQYIRRLFSLKGGFDPSILEDIFPTIQLLDPSEPNLVHMRGARLINGTMASVAAGANIPAVELNTNRGGQVLPPFIFDLDFLIIFNLNAAVAQVTIEHIFETSGTIGVTTQMTPGDGRRLLPADGTERPESMTLMQNLNTSFTALPAQRSMNIPIPANNLIALPLRWTLVRSSLLFKMGAVAGSGIFSFQGRERVLEPSEAF